MLSIRSVDVTQHTVPLSRSTIATNYSITNENIDIIENYNKDVNSNLKVLFNFSNIKKMIQKLKTKYNLIKTSKYDSVNTEEQEQESFKNIPQKNINETLSSDIANQIVPKSRPIFYFDSFEDGGNFSD